MLFPLSQRGKGLGPQRVHRTQKDSNREGSRDWFYDQTSAFQPSISEKTCIGDFWVTVLKSKWMALICTKGSTIKCERLIELVDIHLRWFVLRFSESSTACLLKVICSICSIYKVIYSIVCYCWHSAVFIYNLAWQTCIGIFPELLDALMEGNYTLTEA